MKGITSIIGVVVFYLSAFLSFCWMVIEFILYLAKDLVFNWASVYVFCASVVLLLITYVAGIVVQLKAHREAKPEPRIKSKFQERLHEAMNKTNKL